MPADNELELYIVNDGKLYRDHRRPLQQRLAKAKANGTYDRLRALKGFDALVTEGVRRYRREFPGSSFSASDRKDAASSMLAYFETEHRLGNIRPDDMIEAALVKVQSKAGKKTPAQLDREIAAAVRKR